LALKIALSTDLTPEYIARILAQWAVQRLLAVAGHKSLLTDAGHDPTAQGLARAYEPQLSGEAPPRRPAEAHSCFNAGASGCHRSAVGAGDGRGAAPRVRRDGAQVVTGGLRPHRSCSGGRRRGHWVRHLQVWRGRGGRHRRVSRPRRLHRHRIQDGNE
jgi:hypothetical protein